MIRHFVSIITCLLFIFGASVARAQDTAPEPQQLSDAEKIYGLSLFWKEASYNFAFFDQVPDLDWDAAYQEYVPKVLATKSMKEYWRVMMQFGALLKDGHTEIYPPSALRGKKYFDIAPMLLKSLGRRAIIVNIDTDHADQVPLGSEIIAVNGMPTEQYLRENVIPFISSSTEYMLWDIAISNYMIGMVAGEPLDEVTYTIRTMAGEERKATMIRDAYARSAAGTFKWVTPLQKTGDIIEHRWLEDGLLYVSLNSFADSKIDERFKSEVVPELPKAKGVILDLRRNGGGNTAIGTAILDYFTDQPLNGSRWRTRQNISALQAWGWGESWFQGAVNQFTPSGEQKFLVPIVVLMGHDTFSAAEDFLIFIDGQERFVTVGEPSSGSTGQPLFFDMPGGGSAQVCTKRDTFPDGRDFVGVGVQPEVPVERTIPYLIGEEDPFLDKGVEVLKNMIAGKKY